MRLDTLVERARLLASSVSPAALPGITLQELGLLRDVRAVPMALENGSSQGFIIEISLAPGGLSSDAMAQVRDELLDEMDADNIPARVKTQLSPAWTAQSISASGQEKLRRLGVSLSDADRPSAAPLATIKNIANYAVNSAANSQNAPQTGLSLILQGATHHLPISQERSVLDLALDAGLNIPYGCRAGICCSCRAKLLQGHAEMEANFALQPHEVEAGYILACQARCTSEWVVISCDGP